MAGMLGDYISRCEGLGCSFRDDCKRYELWLQDKTGDKKASICVIPGLLPEGCHTMIRKDR